MLFHHEPIVRDGKIVGFLTSGNYGHALGGAVGLGYVPCPDRESVEQQLSSDYKVEIAGVRIAADISSRPLYDPTSERVRL